MTEDESTPSEDAPAGRAGSAAESPAPTSPAIRLFRICADFNRWTRQTHEDAEAIGPNSSRNSSRARSGSCSRSTTRSCWRATASSAGSAIRSARLVAGDECAETARGAARRRRVAGREPRGRRNAARAVGQRPISTRCSGRCKRWLQPTARLSGRAEVGRKGRRGARRARPRARARKQIKALDQNARAALRKLGVRFGANYVFVPALLKPAPRTLCSQLWALQARREPGAERLLAYAAAGRTSFAVEGALSPNAYRIAGFRLCGERVVRVDIVERLTDLIRAAIPDQMRPGAAGAPRPSASSSRSR